MSDTEPIEAPPRGGQAPNRLLLIAAGVVGVLLVVFLLLKALSGGGGGGSSTATTVPLTGAPSATSSTTTSTTAPTETFEVFNNKNPFVPLRGEATAPAAGATGGATGGGTTATTAAGASGAAAGAASGTASGGGTAAGGGGTAPRRSQRVSLVDVFQEGGRTMANVKVNDTVYKVAAGDSFAGSYKVVSLTQSTGCGRFLFGDEPFQLCKGEEVLK